MASVQTDFQSNDPTLRPPKYQRRRADMFQAVVRLIEDQDGYTIVSKDEPAARMKAQLKKGLAGYDVDFWIEGEANGPVSVHMRATRTSGIDLGGAKKHIRDFTARLHHRES